ncbi:MAG: hypothetical protein U5M23_13530 [Marinagarivorans sp.]|nr:hypothetical protein [Marinagarivorans sp.]
MKKADLNSPDYLLSPFNHPTGLSAMVDGDVSHDRVHVFIRRVQLTRFMAASETTVRQIEQTTGFNF